MYILLKENALVKYNKQSGRERPWSNNNLPTHILPPLSPPYTNRPIQWLTNMISCWTGCVKACTHAHVCVTARLCVFLFLRVRLSAAWHSPASKGMAGLWVGGQAQSEKIMLIVLGRLWKLDPRWRQRRSLSLGHQLLLQHLSSWSFWFTQVRGTNVNLYSMTTLHCWPWPRAYGVVLAAGKKKLQKFFLVLYSLFCIRYVKDFNVIACVVMSRNQKITTILLIRPQYTEFWHFCHTSSVWIP